MMQQSFILLAKKLIPRIAKAKPGCGMQIAVIDYIFCEDEIGYLNMFGVSVVELNMSVESCEIHGSHIINNYLLIKI